MRRHLLLVSVLVVASTAGCDRGRTDRLAQAEYHYKLANNFFYDKNPQSALEELYQVLAIDDHHAPAHHLLGFIYFGRRDNVRALKHFQMAVAIDPDFDEAVANLGNLYLAMEQWEAAIPLFEKLLGKPLYRTPHLAHNNVGWAKLSLGDLAAARHHFEMAIFLNPKFCLGHNNLGRLYAQQGRTELALEHFHKAVELCPLYQEPHYFLGRIYAALAAPEQSAKHFRRCFELGRDAPYGRRCGEAL